MFKWFVIFFSFLFLLSCINIDCIRQPQILSDQTDILLPTQSFVKIEQNVFLIDKNNLTKFSIINSYNGSGSIIKKDKHNTFVLTAGHICEYHKEKEINDPSLLFQNFIVFDLDLNSYHADILKIHTNIDVCVLLVKEIINKPVLKISKIKPVLGDKIYILSAPRGIMNKQMIPIFDGRYDGDIFYTPNKTLSFFSITVAPGSSGSPFLDKDGKLIGILIGQSTEKGLENSIAVGTSYQDIHDLVLDLDL